MKLFPEGGLKQAHLDSNFLRDSYGKNFSLRGLQVLDGAKLHRYIRWPFVSKGQSRP